MKKDKPRTGAKHKPAMTPPGAARAEGEATSTDPVHDADNAAIDIPVVALGGSAGALEPFNLFFAGMPVDSGAAFVVIQHLSPAHESLLPELLTRHTQMKVMQAQQGAVVEANCVYVIPPNQDLGIRDGVLFLAEPVKPKGIPMPIDFFLRSLAEDRREQAVCILLSGAGSDGTLGVRAIRGAGGLTIAQDPLSAQHGDLPRSAIAAGLVDQVLRPEQMPQAVVEYLRQPYVRGGGAAALAADESKAGSLEQILAIVRRQTDCDFRCYKKNTILRRIERRMGLHRISDMDAYRNLLGQEPGEVSQLLKDLLINVTAFFRDAEVFSELCSKVIKPLVAAKPADEPLRVWVAGCASGEEVYSLVILLMEELAATGKSCPLQVFATDIDGEALQFARQGLYPASVAADVDAARLAQYFVRRNQGYQVGEALRHCVVFAAHNLISDPPFSRMDLISCRNLLIYLEADTQTKLIPLFNFALNAGGYLFLGKSEGIGNHADLFSLVSNKARLYRRATAMRPVILDSQLLPNIRKALPGAGLVVKPLAASYAEAARQALLDHFAASVVLVSAKGQILQFYGQTGKYLDLPAAEPSLNLLEIAKGGLSLRLRSALHAACNDKKAVVLESVPITRNTGGPCARVTVAPVPRSGDAAPLLAVIFEDVPQPVAGTGERMPEAMHSVTVQQLEDDLRATQQDLQSNIEELQSSNEELRISGEEVVSANEELQSTNEELETSKEELQSVNEELTTVNNQLQEKVERLDAAYGDMANLLKSSRIATLFLDGNLRIKFFTPATTRVLRLIPADMGRPLADLSVNFIDYDLTADARAVAQGGADLERDVRHMDNSFYVVRIMPYRTQNDRVDGVVVTFDDVTRLRRSELQHQSLFLETKRAAEALREREEQLRLFIEHAPAAIAVFDTGMCYLAASSRWQKDYGLVGQDLRGRSHYEVFPEISERWKEVHRRCLAGAIEQSDEDPFPRADGSLQWIRWEIRPWRTGDGTIGGIIIFSEDITEHKQIESEARRNQQLLNAIIDNSQALIYVKDLDGRIILANRALGAAVGLSPADLLGKTSCELLPNSQDGETHMANDRQIIESGLPQTVEETTPGHVFLSVKFPLRDDQGRIIGTGGVSTDITERKQNEVALHKLNRALQALSQSDRAFMHCANEQDYLDEVCRIIVQDCGYAMVWIGYAQEDPNQTVRPVASSGFDSGYIEKLNVTWADNERGRGPTGTAIRTGKLSVCANMRTDDRFAPWREDALQRGYAASLALPLLTDATLSEEADGATGRPGKVFGAITIYAGETGMFTPDELQLLNALADDMSHGLAILSLRAATQRASQEREITVSFLRKMNAAVTTEALVHAAASFFHEHAGCEAVGIRLQEGDDYPYYETHGFPEEFVKLENSLCARDAAGNVICNAVGDPVHECMCGNVIHGRFNSSKPFFTDKGNFWTNCTTELLATTTDADRQQRTRNRCNGEGYESVALIAMRMGNECLGLLQLNDKRKNIFSPERIALWERLSDYLAVALAKTRAEEAHQRSSRQNALLSAVASQLLAAENPERLFDSLCREVMELLDCDVFINFLADESAGRLRLHASGGLSEAQVQQIECLDYGVAVCGCAARDGKRMVVENIATSLDPRTELARAFGIQAYGCHPLMSEGHVLGTLSFGTRSRPRFRDSDVTLMDAVADLVAMSMARTKSEQALRESEERLRLAQEAAEVEVWDSDLARGVMHCSARVKDWWGLLPEQPATYDAWMARVHPEDRAAAVLAVRQRRLSDPAGAGRRNMEYRLVSPDGSIRWVSIHAQTHVEEVDGRRHVVRIVGTIQDVTARKQAEMELEQSRASLQLALRSSGMATFDWDIVGNRRIWSEGVHHLLGTAPENLTGSAEEFMRGIHPDDRATVQASLDKALETNEYESEYRAVWPDGSIHHISARGKVQRNRNGQPVRMAGVCWDITPRKKMEEELRRAHERLSLAQQSAGAGAWEWDLAADKLEWSPELFHLFGMDPAKTVPTVDMWRETIHPKDRLKTERHLRAAIREHAKISSDYRVLLSSGAIRWIRAIGDVNYDQSGKAVRMAGLCIDVTERKTIEEELHRHAEELAHFNRAMVDRELRMIELKKQVNDLCARLGQTPVYNLDFEKDENGMGR